MNSNGSNNTHPISEGAVNPESSGTIDRTAANNGGSLVSPVRRGGGPRTAQGKDRAKRNSTKLGMFSRASLLEGESLAELKAFSKGLHDHFKPVGVHEEGLVDEIVSNRWRKRRVLGAEAAEIEFEREYGESSNQMIKVNFGSLTSHRGLISANMDDEDTKRAVALLQGLKKRIEANGFDEKNDNLILADLYGDLHRPDDWEPDLRGYYRGLAAIASLPEDVRKRQGLPGPPECRSLFLKMLNEREQKLVRDDNEQNAINSKRTKLDLLRRAVPDSPRLDSILKSLAALERSHDKALSQLERAQAMRLGRPVLPLMKLDM